MDAVGADVVNKILDHWQTYLDRNYSQSAVIRLAVRKLLYKIADDISEIKEKYDNRDDRLDAMASYYWELQQEINGVHESEPADVPEVMAELN